MSNFDKKKFIKDRILSTAEIGKGILKGDSLDVAQGLLGKLEPLYEDILKNAKTEEEAIEALKKAPPKRMAFVFNGAGIIVDLLNISKINEFKFDIFEGTSKEDGKELYYNEERAAGLYALKVLASAAVNFVVSKNIVGAIFTFFVDTTDIFTSNHLVHIDYYDANPESETNINVQERRYIVVNPKGDFDTILNSAWSGISSDINSNLRRVIFSIDGGKSLRSDNVEFIYHKRYKLGSKLNTFEFRQGRDEKKIVSVLKRIGYPINNNKIAHMTFSKGEEPKQLIANYYANYGAGASSVRSDLNLPNDTKENRELKQAAAYALENLKGYALAGDISKKEYINIENYSDNHLNDRANFLKLRVQELTGSAGIYRNTHYYDTKENISAGDKNTIYNEKVDKVVFITGDYTDSRSLFGKKRFYGYSDDNTIISSDDIGVYIESGLGCDTITTGSGNDIIYTNAKIDDGDDKEDSNTINTVNSGKGNDQIYGSKGVDNITVDDGVN
ncbi:calcium-binding protein, partial [Campylobacter geochelonis]|uniref:calcium-binding protein n=1 Tax=Campylobacter geochelonis TaxID=1780362 RepID=UPI000B327874